MLSKYDLGYIEFFFFFSEIGIDLKIRIMERVIEMGEIFCVYYVKVRVLYLKEIVEIIYEICEI